MDKKIVFVEDDSFIIDIYKTAFKEAGLDVEVISWGGEVIKRIKKMQDENAEKPGLFIIDLILPDINGIEVLKEIKNNKAVKDIPVFVLSNYSSPDLQKPDGPKPDKFILKTDITPTKLIKIIKEELGIA